MRPQLGISPVQGTEAMPEDYGLLKCDVSLTVKCQPYLLFYSRQNQTRVDIALIGNLEDRLSDVSLNTRISIVVEKIASSLMSQSVSKDNHSLTVG